MPANASTARRSAGTAAGRPSVKTNAKPSRSRSRGRGGSTGSGAVATARETSSRLPPSLASRPAKSAAAHASRYVSRDRRTSSSSSFRAAWSSSSGASPPRFWANATSACSRSTRARPRSSSGPASAAATSPSAASNAPASRLAWAAANARSARRAGSWVSATERCKKRCRRSETAASLRPPGRPLKLGGHVLVGTEHSLGAVPGTTIRVDLRIGSRGQCSVRAAALRRRRSPVDRGAQERVAEPHACVDLEQVLRLCGPLLRQPGCRARRQRARAGWDHRPDRRPPPAAGVASRWGAASTRRR